ncbi:MAG: T9SS type A sorting domain-containing protein [Cytophagales bacterium]
MKNIFHTFKPKITHIIPVSISLLIIFSFPKIIFAQDFQITQVPINTGNYITSFEIGTDDLLYVCTDSFIYIYDDTILQSQVSHDGSEKIAFGNNDNLLFSSNRIDINSYKNGNSYLFTNDSIPTSPNTFWGIDQIVQLNDGRILYSVRQSSREIFLLDSNSTIQILNSAPTSSYQHFYGGDMVELNPGIFFYRVDLGSQINATINVNTLNYTEYDDAFFNSNILWSYAKNSANELVIHELLSFKKYDGSLNLIDSISFAEFGITSGPVCSRYISTYCDFTGRNYSLCNDELIILDQNDSIFRYVNSDGYDIPNGPVIQGYNVISCKTNSVGELFIATFTEGVYKVKFNNISSLLKEDEHTQAIVYPNPASESINIKTQMNISNANLVSVSGKVFKDIKVAKSGNDTYRLSLPKKALGGYYYLELIGQNNSIVRKKLLLN